MLTDIKPCATIIQDIVREAEEVMLNLKSVIR